LTLREIFNWVVDTPILDLIVGLGVLSVVLPIGFKVLFWFLEEPPLYQKIAKAKRQEERRKYKEEQIRNDLKEQYPDLNQDQIQVKLDEKIKRMQQNAAYLLFGMSFFILVSLFISSIFF
jgi:uncharacterized membrane protein